MATPDLPWSTDHSKYAEKQHCYTGAELLSIEPWNTGTDGFAGCEDRLGQRPKPSESLLELISAIFKVHQSLFLWLCFFINHLTLPCFPLMKKIISLVYFYSYKFFYSIHFAYITFFTCFIWWNNIYNWAIKITINTAKRTENKKRICCFFTTQVIFQATNYNWANIENCTKLPYHFENGFQRRSIFYKSMTICQLLCFPLFLKISVTFFKGTILLRMHTTQIMNQRHD